MAFYKKKFFAISEQDKQGFFQTKFLQNNLRILILAIFLTVEQLYYGFFVSEPGSLLQKIYIFSSGSMLFYCILSLNFQVKKPNYISYSYQIYEISFGFFGLLVAVARTILIQNVVFQLPIILIAVLYGVAVIFYFNPFQSFMVYGISSALLIFLLPIFQSAILSSSYVEDIVSNTIIAWLISYINYKKYVKEYINQKIIEKKNQELSAKTWQIEKMNKKLQQISIKDGLTNIYNRRKLDEVLLYQLNKAEKENENFSVILLDIDGFKLINDTYGHTVGDKVLIELSKILRRYVKNGDLVGRWGGEEFLIICHKTNFNQVLDLAETIRSKIEEHEFSIINKLTSSFGVASYKEGDMLDDIINRADKGLYKAKRSGKNRVEVIC